MPIHATRTYCNSFLEHCLLEAIEMAANVLLTIAPFDVAVNTALQVIGEALRQSIDWYLLQSRSQFDTG